MAGQSYNSWLIIIFNILFAVEAIFYANIEAMTCMFQINIYPMIL